MIGIAIVSVVVLGTLLFAVLCLSGLMDRASLD